MQDDIAFAPSAETFITEKRLTELAAILAAAIARTNLLETREKPPLDRDSSLDILALRRRRGRQMRNRVGDDARRKQRDLGAKAAPSLQAEGTDVLAALTAPRAMTVPELHEKWHAIVGEPAPDASRGNLERRPG